MAHVVPFAGYRYNPKKTPRLADVIAPASGRLALGEAELLHGKNPHHAIRIEAPLKLEGEAPGARFSRAAEAWRAWKKEGVVVPEGPAFYRYESIDRNGEGIASRGLLGRVEILQGSEILVTAETWPKVVASRRSLYEASGAISSPLVFLFEDDGQVGRILEEAVVPSLTAEGAQRTERLFPVTARARTQDLHDYFLKRPVLLLEGHHRLAAAREAARARGLDRAYLPAVFFDRKTGGIRSVPRHRLVIPGAKGGIEKNAFLKSLGEFFEIETYSYKGAGQKEVELRNLMEEIETVGRVNHTFGLYLGDGSFHCLFLENAEAYEREVSVPRSRRWKRMDPVILDVLVFEKILKGKMKTGLAVVPRDAVEMVDEGEAQAALFLLPPLLADVVRLARAGELFPPRPFAIDPVPSTGLLIAEIDAPAPA